MEAAFANEQVLPCEQIAFGRVRIRLDQLVPGETYTVTHPYGVDVFEADEMGTVRSSEDIGGVELPGDFRNALDSRVFQGLLRWDPAVAPAAPDGYIGDPAVGHRVVGSPFGTNFFRVEGPDIGGPGVDTIETDEFSVMVKLAPRP